VTAVWELYDALLEQIPRHLTVTDSLAGTVWTAMRTSGGVGLAMTTAGRTRPPLIRGDLRGRPLIDMAARVKSWNYIEAGLGMAAINAYFNQCEVFGRNGGQPSADGRNEDAFTASYEEIAGKRVCVVGHFPFLERRLCDICELSILERQPQTGDYPDPACEYLLPEADYVFITGSALINKTMPRLLELSKRAKTTLVGTSVPLSPVLFDFGADCLAGFVPTDLDGCWRIAAYEPETLLAKVGQRVRMFKP